MRIDPKRAMREYQKAVEKYELYKQECKAKGEEVLPFEVWEKREINKAWEEGLKQAGMMMIDLGSTKIVTWPPKKKNEKREGSEEGEGGQKSGELDESSQSNTHVVDEKRNKSVEKNG